MKILFFVDDFMGGAGNVVQILSRELVLRGHGVTVCLTKKTADPKHNISGVKTAILLEDTSRNVSQFEKYLTLIRKTRSLIKSESPDVIVSFLFGVSSVVGLSMTGMDIPLIVSERCNPLEVKPKHIWKALRRSAYKKASAVVVLFDAFRSFENGKYLNKTVAIPNPVPSFPNSVYRAYDGDTVFVTLGNHRRVKGFDLLVEAFAILGKQHGRVKLLIYGMQSNNCNLSDKIRELGLDDKVELCGYANDVKSVFSSADAYVMPSRHEGFPNALCEAMAYGLPCAAFLCHEGIADLIQDGVNGVLAEKENPEALAKAMLSLCENHDLLRQYGNEAMKISDLYSVSSVTDRWETLIKNTII